MEPLPGREVRACMVIAVGRDSPETPDLPRGTCATPPISQRSAAPTVPFCLICRWAFSGVNRGNAGTGIPKLPRFLPKLPYFSPKNG